MKACCCRWLVWLGLFCLSGSDLTSSLPVISSSDLVGYADYFCTIVLTDAADENASSLLQRLADVTFVDEPWVRFGLLRTANFSAALGGKLRWVDPGYVEPAENRDIVIFPRRRVDRTCLLRPEGSESSVRAAVYQSFLSVEAVTDFVNIQCSVYRDPDGLLSAKGAHRKAILNSLYRVQSVSDVNIGRLRGSPAAPEGKSADFCNPPTAGAAQCSAGGSTGGSAEKTTIPECERIPPPTKDEFFHRYLKSSRPVIIENALTNWTAMDAWTNSYFRQRFGDNKVHVKLTPHGDYEGVEQASRWEDYQGFQIPKSVKDQLPYPDLVVVRPATLNVNFSKFLDVVESVSNGTLKNVSAYLEYASINQYVPELESHIEQMPFIEGLLEKRHLNIWLSDGNTLGRLHFDPFDNLLCQISGSKQVLLFDPHDNARLYEAHIPEAVLSYNKSTGEFRQKTLLDTTSMVMSPVDVSDPDLQRFPKFSDAYPLNCTIREGEVLFLPAFWWHEVQSRPSVAERRNLAVNFWYNPFLIKEFPCPECKLDINPEYRNLL